MLTLPLTADLLDTNKTELILAIPYEGDALRVYYKDKLLTDNWFSGYTSEQGGAVVGLSYLADENPVRPNQPTNPPVCMNHVSIFLVMCRSRQSISSPECF